MLVLLNADGFKERPQVPAGRKEQVRKQYVTLINVNWKNKNPGDIHSRQNKTKSCKHGRANLSAFINIGQ
jgi:hypothetical protein